MEKFDKISNHSVTLKVTDDNFKNINLNDIPENWKYSGNPNGSHEFVHKYKLDFKNDVLKKLLRDKPINPEHAEIYNLAKSAWVIENAKPLKLYCATALGISNVKQKLGISTIAQNLVKNGKCKNIEDANKFISEFMV